MRSFDYTVDYGDQSASIMVDVINLRQARKAKERADKENRAQANRLKHGRTKADKRQADMDKQRLDSVVDGARREKAGE